jgi:hypothetical protein
VEGKRHNDSGEWEQRKCKEKRTIVKRKAPSLPGKRKCGAHFVRKHKKPIIEDEIYWRRSD